MFECLPESPCYQIHVLTSNPSASDEIPVNQHTDAPAYLNLSLHSGAIEAQFTNVSALRDHFGDVVWVAIQVIKVLFNPSCSSSWRFKNAVVYTNRILLRLNEGLITLINS